MNQNLNDQTESEDVNIRFLHLLENESVSGAIQILLNALFIWSRTCHRLQTESSEISQFTVPSSVVHRAVRQGVYDGLKEVDYSSREERWSHWEPSPPGANAESDERLIQYIVDYATTLPIEDATTFFVKLISQWMKKCSAQAILEDLETYGRSGQISQPIRESELIDELQRALDLMVFDYESMDA